MMSVDATEERLRGALEVDPSPDALRWLDGRIEQAIAHYGRSRQGHLTWRWLLRPVPLLAAFVLLASAVAAGLTLVGRLATASPGWATAWELAEVIEQSESDQGYTVTLERAFADVNQVVAFISVTADDPSLPDPGENGAVWLNGGVRDASGRALETPLSTMAVENELSAYIGTWLDPAVQGGTYVLEYRRSRSSRQTSTRRPSRTRRPGRGDSNSSSRSPWASCSNRRPQRVTTA